ncbi:MAG: hypothetical protein A2X12_10905 [Bacteroidetes bacterium GWE2_29_8]|nr:MAG: hypothetical protein A2X12_10905 [Bacteroidetes bacterium GWE2_29_8]OFY24656.1 MAG: hypothetical protein A2X02_08680 [Bacteroidetes bacterium GWF2_29_10]
MNVFFETIKLKDGILYNIPLHNERLNNTRRRFFKVIYDINLASIIHLPTDCKKGLYKVKVIYSENIIDIAYIKYQKREINSLKIVYNNDVEYHYKYLNRDFLDILKFNVEEDEIIIVKNDFISDASFANIIFFDGITWVTPIVPLFEGIQRAYLINKNFIKEENIRIKDLNRFTKLKLINALNDFNEAPTINISNLIL